MEYTSSGKVKNLKICSAVLTAISGACSLVPHPIAKGVSIAAGLAGVLLGMGSEVKNIEVSNYGSFEPAISDSSVAVR